MKLAMVGLGRMGANMVRRLLKKDGKRGAGGVSCVVYDQDVERARELEAQGAVPVSTFDELVRSLEKPRIVWVMLPSGKITDTVMRELADRLETGDVLIDGGNTLYFDDVARARDLSKKGIRFLDVGVSGGVWGLERGYSLMIGGDPDAANLLDPVFKVLAPGAEHVEKTPGRKRSGTSNATADEGYLYCGPAGSGHFVKMIHNGIEYGMMQALAEGFDLLRGAASERIPEERRYRLDLREISEVWRRGSVVSSWLLDLIAIALNEDPKLSRFAGRVPDSGEGRWTVNAAIEQGTSAEVIATALFVRFRSRLEESFAEKLLSAMRNEFGGHAEARARKLAS